MDKQTTNTVPVHRWMVAQTSALLDSVATSNFACFGRGGVPHYPNHAPDSPPPDPSTLCAELHIQAPDGTTRLALLDLNLDRTEFNDARAVWATFDSGRRTQVIWVWDFYRIQSHAVIRIGVPPTGQQASDALWQTALDAARAMAVGDVILFKAQSTCGSFQQRHILQTAPFEWTPEKS